MTTRREETGIPTVVASHLRDKGRREDGARVVLFIPVTVDSQRY